MRVFLGAFGDPGHAFPFLALGTELVRRGHDVAFQTWHKWEADARRAGMTFLPAPQYPAPTAPDQDWMEPYDAAVRAAQDTVEPVADFAPEVGVADIISLAPALAAEACGVPVATVIPHVTPSPGRPPVGRARFDNGDEERSGHPAAVLAQALRGPAPYPPFAIGARPARTPLGGLAWRGFAPLLAKGLAHGRADYNGARRRLGLAPRGGDHPGLSRELTMVATLPQLEYPRTWPSWMRVTGPLLWEPPGETIAPPPGDPRHPVVLVAPSTAQDAEHRLLRAALDGLADEPVRVIATFNGRRPPWLDGYAVPDNAVLVPWLSYAGTMPACDLAIVHGGHGTLVRALVSGCAVLVVPAAGDQFENAARAAWSGAGVRVPRRLLGPGPVRLAVRQALADDGCRARAREIAASATDGAATAVDHLERWGATVARREGSPGRTRTSKP